jgi:hypothetical protein
MVVLAFVMVASTAAFVRAQVSEGSGRAGALRVFLDCDIGFGISYSFGSIFNNVVNPRFRNAGGF